MVEVLSNGNLIVSGEKQVRVNGEHEFIRLSGVVNPRDIKPGNMLSSTCWLTPALSCKIRATITPLPSLAGLAAFYEHFAVLNPGNPA